MSLKCKITAGFKPILLMLALLSWQLPAKQKIAFSSGATPDSFQAMVMQPILTEAFARIGYELQVEYLPASRSAVLANKGQTDGELNRVSNFFQTTRGQFPNLLRIDPVIVYAKTAIFSRKDLVPCSAKSMNDSAIAFKRGRRLTSKELRSDLYNFSEIFEVGTDRQAIQMLVKGRVEYVQTGLQIGSKLLTQLQANEQFKPCFIRPAKSIHGYIHKKHKDLLPKLTQALTEMKQQGVFEQLKQQATEKFFSNN